MNEVKVNGKLRIMYPDTFHVMDDEEKKNMPTLADGDFTDLSDVENHMKITFGLKVMDGFAAKLGSKLLTAKDLAKNMEKQIRNPMKALVYTFGGFKKCEIGGKKAYGFDYAYKAQDIAMVGEHYVVKDSDAIYYFNLYTRESHRAQNMKVWGEMLESADFL